MARAYRFLEKDEAKPVTLCYFVATVFIGLPVVIILCGSLFVIVSPFLGMEWLMERWRHRHGPPRPWVVPEWVRAKKRRVCPIVEFD